MTDTPCMIHPKYRTGCILRGIRNFLYLFSTLTDTIRKPMKIGCADGVCSHLKSVLTASSASDSACSEQLQFFY